MNVSLKFDNNWRRTLLLHKNSSISLSFTVDIPVEYVALNSKVLPLPVKEFCKHYASQFGFDYDVYSYLLWPMHDSMTTAELSESLNTKFGSCSTIIKKSPIEAHGLDFSNDI